MADIKTYPEMNAKIAGLLRKCGDAQTDPLNHYAALRIEELEQQLAGTEGCLKQAREKIKVLEETIYTWEKQGMRGDEADEHS